MRKQVLIGWIVALALLVVPIGSIDAAEERIARSPDGMTTIVAHAFAFFDRLAERFGFERTQPRVHQATQTPPPGPAPLPPPPPPPEVEEEGEHGPDYDPNG